MPLPIRLIRTYHHEAIDWATRASAAGGSVRVDVVRAVSNFCADIDRAGIRSKIARLNLFVGGFSAITIPVYRSTSYGGTVIGGTSDTNYSFVSGDYAETGSSGGLTGNGTTKYLDTGVASNTFAMSDVHLLADGSSYGLGIGSDGVLIGGRGTTLAGLALQARTSSALINRAFLDRSGGFSVGISAGSPQIENGVLAASSVSATDMRMYADGSQTGLQTGDRGTLTTGSTQPVLVFAFNANGSAVAFSGARLRCYSIGYGLSGSGVSSFTTAIQRFNTALSRT